ncbi:hypothetical protein GW932_00750 [archaeon]|nr:hypothetical protein [archaeon]
MGELEGAERYFFSNETERDSCIEGSIKFGLEKEFLEVVSDYFHKEKPTDKEFNFYFERCSEYLNQKFNSVSAKRKALIDTMNEIYYREEKPSVADLFGDFHNEEDDGTWWKR